MPLIISGTHRADSYSLKVSKIVAGVYHDLKEPCEILSLRDIPFKETFDNPHCAPLPAGFQPFARQVEHSLSLVIVCPEYNGGFPGVLKYFIDHWPYPGSFTYKPVCLIGLGDGRFGALRALEHLQGVLLYRKSCLCPERVLIENVSRAITADLQVKNPDLTERLRRQAEIFIKYAQAVRSALPFKE